MGFNSVVWLSLKIMSKRNKNIVSTEGGIPDFRSKDGLYPVANYIYSFAGEYLAVINEEPLKVQLDDDTDMFIQGIVGKLHGSL